MEGCPWVGGGGVGCLFVLGLDAGNAARLSTDPKCTRMSPHDSTTIPFSNALSSSLPRLSKRRQNEGGSLPSNDDGDKISFGFMPGAEVRIEGVGVEKNCSVERSLGKSCHSVDLFIIVSRR